MRKTFRNLFTSQIFQFRSVYMVHVQIANGQTNSAERESRENRKIPQKMASKVNSLKYKHKQAMNRSQIQPLIVQSVVNCESVLNIFSCILNIQDENLVHVQRVQCTVYSVQEPNQALPLFVTVIISRITIIVIEQECRRIKCKQLSQLNRPTNIFTIWNRLRNRSRKEKKMERTERNVLWVSCELVVICIAWTPCLLLSSLFLFSFNWIIVVVVVIFIIINAPQNTTCLSLAPL